MKEVVLRFSDAEFEKIKLACGDRVKSVFMHRAVMDAVFTKLYGKPTKSEMAKRIARSEQSRQNAYKMNATIRRHNEAARARLEEPPARSNPGGTKLGA